MQRAMEVLLGAVFLLFLVSAHAQVAPGDEDSDCTDLIPPYDENMVMLMNSRHYLQLLEEDTAVWDQRDFDTNNPADPDNPTFFKRHAGGLCRWSVRSCGFRDGPQNNWLFTQFISKAVPTGTDYNVTVTIELLYTLSSCRERYSCNPEIYIHKFDTSGPQHRDVYTEPGNYGLVLRKPGSSPIAQLLLMTVEIPPEVEGFYTAIQDNTSCIQVAQLKVYRHQCAEKQEGLVVFPATAAPVSGAMTVTTLCVPNSLPVTSMLVECNSTGFWNGSSTECVCDPGYVKRINSEHNEFCEACPPGYYRSTSDPETDCLACPANTDTTVEAAGICQCLTGYFRNTEGLDEDCPSGQSYENASVACTQPPGKPVNLQKVYSTNSSLSVDWSPPAYLGERGDIYHTVEYSDPMIAGLMLLAPCGGGCLTDTQCTIENLQPATRYVIVVTAHNGVSDQDRGGALARQSDITLQTSIAPPSKPLNVQAFCNVIIWDQPSSPNGNISRYHISFTYGYGSNITTFEVVALGTNYVIDILLPEEEVEIKVQAENEAGPGIYSDPAYLLCFEPEIGGEADFEGESFVSPCPTIVAVPTTAATAECSTVTTTDTVTETATVTTIDVLPLPTPIVVPTTVTTTVPVTILVTNNVTITDTVTATVTAEETVFVPTTVTINATLTATVTATETQLVSTTLTTTATVTETITATDIVAVPTPVPINITVEVPTTETTTTTVTSQVTATTTEIVTTTAITTLSATPTPCPTLPPVNRTPQPPLPSPSPPACPKPEPCDSCCSECEECMTCEPVATVETSPPSSTTCPPPLPPSSCPTCEPPPVCPSCPSFTFHVSPECARRDRRPGNIQNAQMLDCGMIVWNAPEDEECCHDVITYKVRFYNGTTYRSTHPSQRGVFHIVNSWIKLSAKDLPSSRPLHVVVRSRKEDGVHSPDWIEAGVVSDSYVMDCPRSVN